MLQKILDRILDFLSNHMLVITIVVGLIIVFAGLFMRKCHEDQELLSVSIESNKEIDITPTQIRSIEQIGQWEFLAIDDEELVDTVRHKTLGRDDRLVRIYKGTLRLGIDLSRCQEDWVRVHGDTVSLTLPAVGLLSQHFIDEARTRSFYESGTWDARAKEQLYRKAVRQMKKRCLTPANLKQAEDNAREQFTALFRTFGFQTVECGFEG